jgi:hypothetical protein
MLVAVWCCDNVVVLIKVVIATLPQSISCVRHHIHSASQQNQLISPFMLVAVLSGAVMM